MKKMMKRMLSIMLALSVVFTGLTGLTGCGKELDPNMVSISIINKGYGNQWIGTLMDKFLKSDAAYSQYKYELINSYDDSSVKTDVEGGSKHVYYDLVVHAGNSTMIKNESLVDITEVYNMNYKDGKLSDYMNDSILSSFVQKEGGKEFYTSIPWSKSVRGLLINYDVVEAVLGANWENEYPIRTTNEFLAFVTALNNRLPSNKKPFVLYSQDNYYDGLYEIWWAQFEGMKGVENYYNAKYEEGGEVKEGQKAFLQEGRLHSLKVMEQIFSNQNNYEIYSNWNGMQAAYMEGKSAMLVNGDWLYNEMGSKYENVDIRFVKAPVISALGVELGVTTDFNIVDNGNMDITYNVNSEDKFIEIIDYVDKINNGIQADKPAGVSDEIINRIAEARSMIYSNIDYPCISIPVYSNKSDLMINFIKWLYSDAGQKEYVLAMKGLTLPVDNDATEGVALSGFATSLKEITKNATYVFPNRNWKYAKAGLVSFTARREGPIEYLLTGKSDTPSCDSAFEIYNYDYNYYNKGNNWSLLQTMAK